VKELSVALGATVICMPDGDREVTGGYAGDLLSWVMGRAKADDAWITIMSNINIVAVAALVDTACIILAEDTVVDDDVKAVAEEKGVNIFSTDKTAYEIAVGLSELLK
ncbi:MAG: DRTGG domain-containing protein, partial [Clostridia bacterium]|nr:DRTGG domain-containing protein [Clostridia bacterium]